MSTDNKDLKNLSKSLRKNILLMALEAGSSSAHIGGALSLTDLMSVLIGKKLIYKKSEPTWEGRDRIILSKGHGCLAYYASLFELGHLSEKELLTFEKNDSELLGHPVRNIEKGIEFSTGSLGMGLSLGIGVGLALRKKKQTNKIYIILGDGECNEGSVWEAAMAAKHFNLDNLTVILDNNNLQQTGSNKDIMDLGDLKSKWASFGWLTEVIDGHDFKEIENVLDKNSPANSPKVIIAKTVKGKGVSFFENNNAWHHSVLTKKKYDEAINEINAEN